MSELPDGARKFKARKLGPGYHWVETLMVDAELVRHGVTWLRVAGGFGAKGDREDWIAAVPGTGISVNDYNWNGDSFGENLGSTREEAMDATVARQIEPGYLPDGVAKATKELTVRAEALRTFADAVAQRQAISDEGEA